MTRGDSDAGIGHYWRASRRICRFGVEWPCVAWAWGWVLCCIFRAETSKTPLHLDAEDNTAGGQIMNSYILILFTITATTMYIGSQTHMSLQRPHKALPAHSREGEGEGEGGRGWGRGGCGDESIHTDTNVCVLAVLVDKSEHDLVQRHSFVQKHLHHL